MRRIHFVLLLAFLFAPVLRAQDKPAPPDRSTSADPKRQQYSGTYSFLEEGEFVQLTVEDDNRVTGFISRFGDGENKGDFLDQFFKTGKLEGNKLTFTTQIVHGVTFDFKGTVERGAGKDPGDEAYFVLKGSLTQTRTDANKKTMTNSQDVEFTQFPRDAATGPPRN